MSKSNLSLREGLLFLCGLLILGSSLAVSNGRILGISQAPRKSLSEGIVLRQIERDPVRITNTRVGPTAHRFDEEFDESDDWLRKLSMEIENRWNKPIVYLLISLDFPETKSSGNEMRFYVYLGNEPGSPLPAKRENIYIAPSGKFVINMADRYEWLTQFLQPRQRRNEWISMATSSDIDRR
ncbi:MAG: hypothetical protein ABR607_03210 [Pyrinomonadaceae bacterium]